jgi:hypothetical protein
MRRHQGGTGCGTRGCGSQALDLAIDVTFMWYDKERAANPGAVGTLKRTSDPAVQRL